MLRVAVVPLSKKSTVLLQQCMCSRPCSETGAVQLCVRLALI